MAVHGKPPCNPGAGTHGIRWLTLDMEHSAFDWSHAATIFAAVADAGCVPLARVPEGDHYCIKRVLDAGAWGIVVPMVDTVEQARTAIAAAKYPPEGTRSVGGGMHSLNYDATAGDYYEQANDEILVVLQTESPTGVENARISTRCRAAMPSSSVPMIYASKCASRMERCPLRKLTKKWSNASSQSERRWEPQQASMP